MTLRQQTFFAPCAHSSTRCTHERENLHAWLTIFAHLRTSTRAAARDCTLFAALLVAAVHARCKEGPQMVPPASVTRKACRICGQEGLNIAAAAAESTMVSSCLLALFATRRLPQTYVTDAAVRYGCVLVSLEILERVEGDAGRGATEGGSSGSPAPTDDSFFGSLRMLAYVG